MKRESEYIKLAQDWSQRLGELEQLRSDLRDRYSLKTSLSATTATSYAGSRGTVVSEDRFRRGLASIII